MVVGVDGVTFLFVTLIAGVGVLGLVRGCGSANALDLYKLGANLSSQASPNLRVRPRLISLPRWTLS